MGDLVSAQQRLHQEVLERARANRVRMRESASKGTPPNFGVGKYVAVLRVNKRGEVNKLVSIWTGPWRVVSALVASTCTVRRIPVLATARRCKSRG